MFCHMISKTAAFIISLHGISLRTGAQNHSRTRHEVDKVVTIAREVNELAWWVRDTSNAYVSWRICHSCKQAGSIS